MKKTLTIILSVCMLLTVAGALGITGYAEGTPAITSPAAGAALDISSPVTVTGTLPQGTTAAEILVDGEKVADITDLSENFSQSVSFAGLSLEEHAITVSAVCNETVESAPVSVRFVQYGLGTLVSMPISSKINTESTKKFTYSENGATLTVSADYSYLVSLTDGMIKAYRTGSDDFPVVTAYSLPSGMIGEETYILEYDLRVESLWNLSDRELMNTRLKIGSKLTGDTSFIKDGVITYADETTQAIDNSILYRMRATMDFKNGTVKYELNDKEIRTVSEPGIIGGTASISVESRMMKVYGVIWIENIALYGMTDISNINSKGFTVNGTDTDEELWNGDSIPFNVQKLYIKLDSSISAYGVDTQNDVKLFKKSAASWKNVGAEASIADGKVIVTPTESLENNAEYKILVSGLAQGGMTFAGAYAATFKTTEPFSVVPADNTLYEIASDSTQSIVIGVNSLIPAVTPILKLDGEEVALTNGRASIAAGNITYGVHTLEAVVGDETKTSTFEVTSPNAGTGGRSIDIYALCTGISEKSWTNPPAWSTRNHYVFTSAGNGIDFDVWQNGRGSYDTPLSTNTLCYSMNLKLIEYGWPLDIVPQGTNSGWGSLGINHLIDKDGRFAETDMLFPLGDWHKIRFVVNMDTKDYALYLDEEYVNGGNYDGIKSDTNRVQLAFKPGSAYTGKKVYAGDMMVKGWDVNPRYTGSKTVSALADEWTLSFDKPFTAVTADDVTVNGKKAKNVAASENDVIITLPDDLMIEKETNYEVKFAGTLGYVGAGEAIGKDLSVFVKTDADEGNDIFGDIMISEDSLKADVSIFKTAAQSTIPDGALFIVAAYNDDESRLIGIDMEKLNPKAGVLTNAQVSLYSVEGAAKVKAFLWGADSVGPIRVAEKTLSVN